MWESGWNTEAYLLRKMILLFIKFSLKILTWSYRCVQFVLRGENILPSLSSKSNKIFVYHFKTLFRFKCILCVFMLFIFIWSKPVSKLVVWSDCIFQINLKVVNSVHPEDLSIQKTTIESYKKFEYEHGNYVSLYNFLRNVLREQEGKKHHNSSSCFQQFYSKAANN